MTPPQGSFPRPTRPKPASPAERGAEFAEAQKKLKSEAAERREQAADKVVDERPVRRPVGRASSK